nr:phosphoribosyltransferase family protein [Rothia dentocariosa]
MKNAGRTDAVPELARALGRAVATIIDRARVPAGTRILLIPAPSSRRSVQRRGYVPAELLVRQVEHELNRSVALHRRKVRVKTHHILSLEKENIYQRLIRPNTAGQKTLGASARAQRMEGAMRVSPRADVAGALCIVCDDVMTTGATVFEASRALRQAGARVLGAACVAAVSMQKKVDEEALIAHPD